MREHGLRLKPDEGVKVMEGVFTGADAQMLTAKSVNSVRVLLDMFGGRWLTAVRSQRSLERNRFQRSDWRYASLRGASQ